MKVSVDINQARISIDQTLTLGSTYFVEIENYTPAADEDLVLVITDCDNVPLARSEKGSITLNSITLVDLFSADSCGDGRVFHCYLWSNKGITLGSGLITIAYSPLYSDAGEPILMRGAKGEKGDKGEAGADGRDGINGRDGANGAYVPIGGLYAFHVSQGDGDHPTPDHLWIHGQDETSLYAHDDDGNLIKDENGNYIPLFYLDENGHLLYRFMDNGRVHQLLDLGYVRGSEGPVGPQGPQGEKGDDGAGITEEEKEAINSAIANIPVLQNGLSALDASLESHKSAQNPHGINAGMIGAVDETTFTNTINATRDEFIHKIEEGDETVLNQVTEKLGGYVANEDFTASNIHLQQIDKNLEEFSNNVNYFLGSLPSSSQIVSWNSAGFSYDTLPSSESTRNYEIVFLRDSNNHSDIVPYVCIDKTWYAMCSYTGSDTVSSSSKISIGTKDTFYHISESSIEIEIPSGLNPVCVYKGEFCIENTTADITLTTPSATTWVGDVPDFSVLGKHFFAYKYFNSKLYLNEYFVEEA